jgi:hypothetical protein
VILTVRPSLSDQALSESEMSEREVGIRLRDSNQRVGVDALKTENTVAFQMLAFISDVLKEKKTRKWTYAFAKKTSGDDIISHDWKAG